MNKRDQNNALENISFQEGTKDRHDSGPGIHSTSVTSEDELTLKQLMAALANYWEYLLKKWPIIIATGLFGGLIGFAYAYVQKPIYIGELTFAMEDEKGGGGLGGALGLASQFGFDMGSSGGAFSGDNLLQFMKSRSMIEKSLLTAVMINKKEQTLADFYIDIHNLRNGWMSKPHLINIHFLPREDRRTFSITKDSILGEIHKSVKNNLLTVDKLDKKLSILVVRVRSENELFSKYFTEVLTREVSNFYVETKTIKSSQNKEILQHQTDSIRRELNSAISGVAYSIDVNPNANRARQSLTVPSQRRQVDVQANSAILTELIKNLEIAKVSLRKETPLIQVIDRPILPLQKIKVSRRNALLTGGFIGAFMVIIVLSVNKFLRDLT